MTNGQKIGTAAALLLLGGVIYFKFIKVGNDVAEAAKPDGGGGGSSVPRTVAPLMLLGRSQILQPSVIVATRGPKAPTPSLPQSPTIKYSAPQVVPLPQPVIKGGGKVITSADGYGWKSDY